MKGGEDLRIDQRMEQLLDVSNGLLARDAAAAGHGLQVRLRCSLVCLDELSVVMAVCALPPHEYPMKEPRYSHTAVLIVCSTVHWCACACNEHMVWHTAVPRSLAGEQR